jgi:type I restriction enzyme, S subunit
VTWPRYADYRGSDAPWIGDVPSGWPVLQVKSRFGITLGKMLNERVTQSLIGELRPYLRAGNVQPGGLNLTEVKFTLLTAAERKALTLLRGDLVVVEGGAGYGRSAVLQDDLPDWGFQNHIMRVRPTKGDLNPFLDYVIKALNWNGHISTLSNHATIPSLSSEQLERIRIPMPDIPTQQAIIDFLGYETSKIDALIGKQEKLIATLREDRTATITHAVTKGLDPHVKLVDSGVAWLGDMPSHWVPARLKNVILSIDSGTSVNGSDSPAGPDEIGVLKTSCVSAGWFNADANKTVLEEDLSRVTCPVQEEALIVNRANTPVLVGSAGYVSHAPQGLYLSDKLWQVRFGGGLAAFAYFWTQTQVYRSQIAASCVGASSSMQNLSMGDFRNVAIALPPEVEQRSIVSFLSARTTTIDALIAKSNEVIETIREYRSALITDAVTGKIDVRGAA